MRDSSRRGRQWRANAADLVESNNFTVNALQLLQSAHEVPETSTRNDRVGGENAHAVHGRISILLGRLSASNNSKLLILRDMIRRDVSNRRRNDRTKSQQVAENKAR